MIIYSFTTFITPALPFILTAIIYKAYLCMQIKLGPLPTAITSETLLAEQFITLTVLSI